jgi:hypothetical protein
MSGLPASPSQAVWQPHYSLDTHFHSTCIGGPALCPLGDQEGFVQRGSVYSFTQIFAGTHYIDFKNCGDLPKPPILNKNIWVNENSGTLKYLFAVTIFKIFQLSQLWSSRLMKSLLLTPFFFFGGIGVWTQGLSFATQALYHLSYSISLEVYFWYLTLIS